ncbi:MAG: MerR family transcriptional regulator [Solirubrobacteraceae bacterium]
MAATDTASSASASERLKSFVEAADAAGGVGGGATGALRIGDLAKLVGTTPRTIRYYEEIGLLPQAPDRAAGRHRLYTEAEVERLREVMRLKQLLGVSLEQLKTLLAAEEARAAVRAQLRRGDVHPQRRRKLLHEALGHIERQLELVRGRVGELTRLERELAESRGRVKRKLRELGGEDATDA